MPSSTCLRGFAQLSLDTNIRAVHTPRLVRPLAACFTTSAVHNAQAPKKKALTAAPKKGVKSLNTKKGRKAPGGDSGKRPGQGERKAQRKRIVLSNNNALEVSSLKDLTKSNVLSEENEGRVMGLPAVPVVDALREVEAFKTTQGWSLFRRPAVLMRREAIQLAKLFKEVEDSADGKAKKTIRRIISGERMSGKSTLILQGLTTGFLREWFVINLPEGEDFRNRHRRAGADPSQHKTLLMRIRNMRHSLTRNQCSTLRTSTWPNCYSKYKRPMQPSYKTQNC